MLSWGTDDDDAPSISIKMLYVDGFTGYNECAMERAASMLRVFLQGETTKKARKNGVSRDSNSPTALLAVFARS